MKNSVTGGTQLPKPLASKNSTIEERRDSQKQLGTNQLAVGTKAGPSQLALALRRSLAQAAAAHDDVDRARSSHSGLSPIAGQVRAQYGTADYHNLQEDGLPPRARKASSSFKQKSRAQNRLAPVANDMATQHDHRGLNNGPLPPNGLHLSASASHLDSHNYGHSPPLLSHAPTNKYTSSIAVIHSSSSGLELPRQNLKLLERLQNAQPSLSTLTEKRRTQELRHMKVNWKRLQLQDDRSAEIERENRALLSKMQRIYNSKPKAGGAHIYRGHHNLGISGIEDSARQATKEVHRRNALLRRKQKQDKIMLENQRMLQRLQNKKSVYDIEKWQREEDQRQKLLRRVSKEPKTQNTTGVKEPFVDERPSVMGGARAEIYIGGGPQVGGARLRAYMPGSKGSLGVNHLRSSKNLLDRGDHAADFQTQLQRYYVSTMEPRVDTRSQRKSKLASRSQSIDSHDPTRLLTTSLSKLQDLDLLNRTAHQEQEPRQKHGSRLLLFKKGLLINNSFFLCEIFENTRGYAISLHPIDKGLVQDQYHRRMKLFLGRDSPMTHQVLQQYGGNLGEIAHALRIRSGQIVIPLKNYHTSLSPQLLSKRDYVADLEDIEHSRRLRYASQQRLDPRAAASSAEKVSRTEDTSALMRQELRPADIIANGSEVDEYSAPSGEASLEVHSLAQDALPSELLEQQTQTRTAGTLAHFEEQPDAVAAQPGQEGLVDHRNDPQATLDDATIKNTRQQHSNDNPSNLLPSLTSGKQAPKAQKLDPGLSALASNDAVPAKPRFLPTDVYHGADGQHQNNALALPSKDAGDPKKSTNLQISLDSRRRYTLESPLDAAQNIRNQHIRRRLTNQHSSTIGPESAAVRFQELSSSIKKKSSNVPSLKVKAADSTNNRVDAAQSSKRGAIASSGIMNNSAINSSRYIDKIHLELRAEDQRLLKEYYLSKLRTKKTRKGHRLQHQSILKHSRSKASGQTLENRDHFLMRKGPRSSLEPSLSPQMTSDGALRGNSAGRSRPLAKDSNGKLYSREDSMEHEIGSYNSLENVYIKGRGLRGGNFDIYIENQLKTMGGAVAGGRKKRSEAQSEEPYQGHGFVDLPRIVNEQQRQLIKVRSSKDVGAVPSFPERIPAGGVRIQEFLDKQRRNGFKIAPVSESNTKSQASHPYYQDGLTSAEQSAAAREGPILGQRRNTAKANLYEEGEPNPYDQPFEEPHNAYELKPRKIIKRKPANVFERLSRVKRTMDSKSSQMDGSGSRTRAQKKCAPTGSKRSNAQLKSNANSSSPGQNGVIASDKSKTRDAPSLQAIPKLSNRTPAAQYLSRQEQVRTESTFQNRLLTFQNKDQRSSPASTMQKSANSDLQELQIGDEDLQGTSSPKAEIAASSSKATIPKKKLKRVIEKEIKVQQEYEAYRQETEETEDVDKKRGAHAHNQSSIHIARNPLPAFAPNAVSASSVDVKAYQDQEVVAPRNARAAGAILLTDKGSRSIPSNAGRVEPLQAEYTGEDSGSGDPTSFRSRTSIVKDHGKRTLKHGHTVDESSSLYGRVDQNDRHAQQHRMRMQTQNMTGSGRLHDQDSSDGRGPAAQSQNQLAAKSKEAMQARPAQTDGASQKAQYGRQRQPKVTGAGQNDEGVVSGGDFKAYDYYEKGGSATGASHEHQNRRLSADEEYGQDGPKITTRSRVQDYGEKLQPSSLLDEIKREVSEYSQSQKYFLRRRESELKHGQKHSGVDNEGDSIEEATSEFSEGYVTPQQMKLSGHDGNKTAERGNIKRRATDIRDKKASTFDQEDQDLTPNGQDDCISFNGGVHSNEDAGTGPADEHGQMNQTGQFSAEPKATTDKRSESISGPLQSVGQATPNETNQKVVYAGEDTQQQPASEVVASSAQDAYSNDFIPESSSSRREQDRQEGFDAMRLKSFPFGARAQDTESGRKFNEALRMGNAKNHGGARDEEQQYLRGAEAKRHEFVDSSAADSATVPPRGVNLDRRAQAEDLSHQRDSRRTSQRQVQQYASNRGTAGLAEPKLGMSSPSSSQRVQLELLQKSRAADAIYESSDGAGRGPEMAAVSTTLADDAKYAGARQVVNSGSRAPVPNIKRIHPRFPDQGPVTSGKIQTPMPSALNEIEPPSSHYASARNGDEANRENGPSAETDDFYSDDFQDEPSEKDEPSTRTAAKNLVPQRQKR